MTNRINDVAITSVGPLMLKGPEFPSERVCVVSGFCTAKQFLEN